jgi:hypothetical protein
MNTKNEQDQKKNQRLKARQDQGPMKRDQHPNKLHVTAAHQDHEQEHPETRMTR